ncbi:glutaminase kidney isoform, mitochondrial-like [Anarrhichthys ocellatus]|uniref:glutaminase kidney isoform, mitochondrial-like n=1 Tax=Anarrhichthys ocellatus TaxID=433405 RepID=UPI0012ED3426|nr:glutaminase kidney isoform, mitochondrial-like [Anarrhichthys ocellatus]
MLHFRCSTVLKELFEATLKRPLSGSRRKPWSPIRHRCFGAASVDARAVSTPLKVLYAAAPRAALFRSYCTKTEGAVELEERLKKDGVSSEESSEKRRNASILPSLEDLLFHTVADGQETIPAHKFLTALKATGLRSGDPRLKECMDTLKETLRNTSDGVTLDRHLFKKCVQSNIVLLTQAFRKKFVIPDFQSFTSHIDELYESAKKLSGGQVADYIPQLAKFSPDLWAVSLCTVDGQRHTVGDTKVPFCLQSCVKPLKYAVAIHDHSTEYVHSFIGKEPSGLRFNKLFLNDDDKPHNPMVNAGAIVCTSLIKQGASNAERFDYVSIRGQTWSIIEVRSSLLTFMIFVKSPCLDD